MTRILHQGIVMVAPHSCLHGISVSLHKVAPVKRSISEIINYLHGFLWPCEQCANQVECFAGTRQVFSDPRYG